MELVSLGKEMLHAVAEKAASYKMGQSVLRQVDRALWVVEKCSKWSVPVHRDEGPQQELVRPLPWLVFLPMLIILRLAREAISLFNLVLGKPPLRSADVVMYIQSKRRSLRTLKYQGNRAMRSRSSTSQQPWYTNIQKLFEFTMCFRRNSQLYGNNNTTQISNNDEILVVKRSKRGRESSGEEAASIESTESTMERLITKMMADIDADSDDDSSYTLTNATSVNSINTVDSEQEHEIMPNGASTPTSINSSAENNFDNVNNVTITQSDTNDQQNGTTDTYVSDTKENSDINNKCDKGFMSMSQTEDLSMIKSENINDITNYDKTESLSMINNERKTNSVNQSTRINNKIANGRAMSRVTKKSKGQLSERRDSDVPLVRITTNDSP